MGAFKYSELAFGIQPYCGVFKTLGDMRLATNLFQGLNYFVSSMVKSTDSNNLQSELRQLFEDKGRFV